MSGKFCNLSIRCLSSVFLGLLLVALAGCQGISSSSLKESDDAVVNTRFLNADDEWRWSPESKCSSCHQSEDSSRENSSCVAKAQTPSKINDGIFEQNGVTENDTCFACHDDVRGLYKAHENGPSISDGAELRETTVADAQCLTDDCHSVEDLEDVAEEYPGASGLDNVAIDPHIINQRENAPSWAVPECIECHTLHE